MLLPPVGRRDRIREVCSCLCLNSQPHVQVPGLGMGLPLMQPALGVNLPMDMMTAGMMGGGFPVQLMGVEASGAAPGVQGESTPQCHMTKVHVLIKILASLVCQVVAGSGC